MTLLHVYFTLRNQQAFQRLLERDRSGGAGSSQTTGGLSHGHGATGTSAGKSQSSWTPRSKSAGAVNLSIIAPALVDVNALDGLGRTVLHRACSAISDSPSSAASSVEYVRMLLAHPGVNVNVVDRESHWTALHRALYAGNVEAAIMLLKRTDTDTSIKDMEGYTAFDLYNSTVRHASPPGTTILQLGDGHHADLLTWGANRNAALGLGDSNDRTHPDHVVLKKDAPLPLERPLHERFESVKVRSVAMSKLHTVILTDEPRDNVWLCGFGGGGRLGPFSHTLYTPTPLVPFSVSIVSVALGQDHTLALTNSGEVVSWGLNRFAQLGYVVESGQGGSADESVQTTPRKVGHLKKEVIVGVAACKTASACWSAEDVWTWGTNGGQLGYSRTASPVQVLPRKASIITQPIRGIAMSETAMVCLFKTGEVVCVWNGGVSRINFPANAFPSDISTVYRPPQAVRAPPVTKLAFCDDVFAALSSNGEVFTFSLPNVADTDGGGGGRGQIKPQRAWALRRQSSSVQDVDIGGDGALIVRTQSGHVFVRSRNLKGATTSGGVKAFRFHRVAHVQRIVAVCANSTGSFGALRVDYRPSPIHVTGRHFSADMTAIVPYILNKAEGSACKDTNVHLDAIVGTDDDPEDSSILDDITEVAKLLAVLCHRTDQVVSSNLRHGADLSLRVGTDFGVPVHRVVLVARSAPLCGVLSGNHGGLYDELSKVSITFSPCLPDAQPTLHITGVSPLSSLALLHYLYADEVLAVWDRRIGSVFEAQFSSLGLSATRVKTDLVALARLLRLPHLMSALQSTGKHVAKPSAREDFQRLFDQAQLLSGTRRNVYEDPLAPDVALHLADKTIYTHSVILRARSAFFGAFFADPDWTIDRRDGAGVVDVDMRHLKWHVVRFVVPFVCFGEEAMFETLEFVGNVDELLELMFLVISVANELLLTRLVLLCSCVVLKYLNTYNACYLLTEAVHFSAVDLTERIQSYMTANLELLLESRILDDLDSRVVRRFSEHVRREQADMSPVSRSDKLGLAALEKHGAWLALQDIPGPVVPSMKVAWSGVGREASSRVSPPIGSSLGKKSTGGAQLKPASPTTSPMLRPSMEPLPLQQQPSSLSLGDEIFAMDDLKLNSVQTASGRGSEEMVVSPGKPGWKKNPATPRTDLKAIMAEVENGKKQAYAQLGVGSGSTGVNAGSGSSSTATANAASSRQQPGQVLPRQSRRCEVPSTPRRIPSDFAIPPKPDTPSVPTMGYSRSTRATQATPSPNTPMTTSSTSSRPVSVLGPVIIPVRQTSNGSGSASGGGNARKPSWGGAWTLPPVQPIAAPSVPSSSTAAGAVSFAEIQRMQALQGTAGVTTDKRSLRDIQEEERALQQETDFLKWWDAEEERVRLEMSIQERRGRAETGHQGKERTGQGGRARPRKPKAERNSSGGIGTGNQQQESHDSIRKRARQREELNARR